MGAGQQATADVRITAALTDWKARQSDAHEFGQHVAERCRLCRSFFSGWEVPKQVKHLRSIPHVAEVWNVYVWDLSRAVRAVALLDGTYKEPRRKARGWRRRIDAAQAVRRAREMLEAHRTALRREQDLVRKWKSRLRDAERAAAKAAAQKETQE